MAGTRGSPPPPPNQLLLSSGQPHLVPATQLPPPNQLPSSSGQPHLVPATQLPPRPPYLWPPTHSHSLVVPPPPPPPLSLCRPPFPMVSSSHSAPMPTAGSAGSIDSRTQTSQAPPVPVPYCAQAGGLPGVVLSSGPGMQFPRGAPLFLCQSPTASEAISSHFVRLPTPASGFAVAATGSHFNQQHFGHVPGSGELFRLEPNCNSSFQSLLMNVSGSHCPVSVQNTNAPFWSGFPGSFSSHPIPVSGTEYRVPHLICFDGRQVEKQRVETAVEGISEIEPTNAKGYPSFTFGKSGKNAGPGNSVEGSSETEPSKASGSNSFTFGEAGKKPVPRKRRAGFSKVSSPPAVVQKDNLETGVNKHQEHPEAWKTPGRKQYVPSDTEGEESDEEVTAVPNEEEVLKELGIVDQLNQLHVEDEYDSENDTSHDSDTEVQYEEPPEFVVDISDDSDSDEEDHHHHSEGQQSPKPAASASLQFEINQSVFGDCGCSSGKTMYKRRKRVRKGTVRPDCRTPRGMGAIEIAMRNSSNRTTEFIFEPVLGLVFDCKAEAYQFYNLFSWEVGFGIRFGNSSINRGNGYQTMQELVCEKEGFDNRCTQSSKRDGCKAMIRLHRTEDFGWYVSKHVADHNHPLSVSCGEKREWNSHSKIEQCTKDMILYLRENNVTLSRVHCIMGSLFGSMEDVPFNQKSLRAVCRQIASDQRDDDVTKTLRIFRKMRQEDPGFQFAVDTDVDNKIKTLIWVSGRSRSQWNYFGDVVTFDTTYCTNLYKMPFGMFVGVNNHFQSVLFAGVLMRDETAKSFKWVFNEFLTLMGGKAPVTILTDQCKAMAKAIRLVMPATTHLWCKWHVLKQAPEELGPIYRVNSPFRREFHYVVNEMLTVDEFEKAWVDLLDRYELHGHPFMEKTYNKRKMWAKPWSKGVFCARMTSTQRSESANSFLKKVVPRNSSMNRFVEQYRKLLFMRTAAEETAEHNTKQFEFRGKRMYAVEQHAFSVYTKKAFMLFSAEVDKAAQYVVNGGNGQFQVVHINDKVRKHWARGCFSVSVSDTGEKYTCECGLFDHFGMLCCHAIKVMIHNGVAKIPDCHILKRWTRNARDSSHRELLDQMVGSVTNQLKQSLLYGDALDVVRKANNDSDIHDIVRRNLKITNQEIDRLLEWRRNQPGYKQTGQGNAGGGKQISIHSDCDDAPTNTYGASGSSAYMSDSDIESILAPDVNRRKGRPKANRFRRGSEIKGKKKKKKQAGVPIRTAVTVARKPPVGKKISKFVTKRRDDVN